MNRPVTWCDFERQALESLRYNGELGVYQRLQVVCEPAFENPQSWTVLDLLREHGQKENHLTVVTRTWRLDLDYPDVDAESAPDPDDELFEEHLASQLPLRPTIESSTHHMQKELITPHLARLTALAIPPYVDGEIGHDGVGYELTIGSTVHGSTFRWWCEGPLQWKPITSIAFEIIPLLQNGSK